MARKLTSNLALLVLVAAEAASAGQEPNPPGVLAMSAGEAVVLLDPATGAVHDFATGPVGFLYPAPGGVLFAPDLVHGRTSVIDLRQARLAEVLAGVTMPRFGPWDDRYLVVAGALTIVSYPERSLITRMEADFSSPWQVEIGPVGMTLLILERDLGGERGAVLSAVDLTSRAVVARRRFDEDLMRFAVVPEVAAIAVAETAGGRIRLLESSTFLDLGELAFGARPTDLLTVGGGRDLLASGAAGTIVRWRMRTARDDRLVKTEEKRIAIPGTGLRMALSPSGESVAVAIDQGVVVIVDPKRARVEATWEVETTALRDLVWCDPGRPGPVLPRWSDAGGGPEAIELESSKK